MAATTILNQPIARKLPYAPGAQLLSGHLNAFNTQTLDFLESNRDGGNIVRFSFGPLPAYLLNTPDGVHEMLVKQPDVWGKSPLTRKVLFPLIGDGLFTSEGELWKTQRRMIAPLFHTRHVPSYGDLMSGYTQDLIATWQDGETRRLDQDFTHLTMQIISKVLFDADVASDAPTVGEAVRQVLHVVEKKFQGVFQMPDWLPTPGNLHMKKHVATLDEFIQKFIDSRRALRQSEMEEKSDLLTMLLNSQDEDGGRMSDKQIRDEAMTFFGAGHETTTTTLAWTAYLLSQNPHVMEKMQAELDRVLQGRLPNYHDLAQLTYTDQVIKEAMRLYPVAFVVFRVSQAASTLGGVKFPANSIAIANIWGIHRDPRYYADPLQFVPERWTPEFEKSLPKMAYLPFGGGPRICIGNAFALMEARLVVATMMQKFSIQLAPGFEVIPERQFTVKPKHGLEMVVHKRK